jgi:hypothetical protein
VSQGKRFTATRTVRIAPLSPITSLATATVRVAEYDRPSVYTKAGLVFRNDLTAWGRSPGYVALANIPSM